MIAHNPSLNPVISAAKTAIHAAKKLRRSIVNIEGSIAGKITFLHISNFPFIQSVFAESIRFWGTISIALIVAITRIKNTPIKTIKTAAEFQTQNITSASGIHAIGAIGANIRTTGSTSLLNQIDDVISEPITIAVNAPRESHEITRKTLAIIDSTSVEELLPIHTLKSFLKRSTKKWEGGGNIFVYPKPFIVAYSHNNISVPIDITQYIIEKSLWLSFLIY